MSEDEDNRKPAAKPTNGEPEEEDVLPSFPPLTQEQLDILDTCPRPNLNRSLGQKGQLTRITAAAGAGKTTTLLALAVRALELGHDHITYVTFTTAAAMDGKGRLERVLAQILPAGQAPPTIDARTLHSCAHRLLQQHVSEHGDGEAQRPKLWSDKGIKRWISEACRTEMDHFLRPCFAEIARGGDDASIRHERERRAEEQVVFFIFKSLNNFCQSNWTLETYQSGVPFNRDYYPAVLFHQPKPKGKGGDYGFHPNVYNQKNKIAFYANQASKLWETILKDDIRSFDFEMKRAQLLKLQVPGSLLLVDESQDMDACQIDWITQQQVEYGTHVYCVGDPAQAIYGFRGAKPQFLMELRSDVDKMLTETWRFGGAISRIANLILYAKENSDQTVMTNDGRYKNWIPYRTRAGVLDKESRVTTKALLPEWRSTKVTVIARSNATLLLEALGVLEFSFAEEESDDEAVDGEDDFNGEGEEGAHLQDRNVSVVVTPDSDDEFEPSPDDQESLTTVNPEPLPMDMPKIHINGRGEGSGRKLWRKSLQLVESVYELYRLSKRDAYATTTLDSKLFPDFARKSVSWETFCDECIQKELTNYSNVIHVVSMCKDRTLEAMDTFRLRVLDQNISADEADIILTTCHSAKGMEWDTVQVCDDFIPLCAFKRKPGNSPLPSPVTVGGSPKRARLLDGWQFAFQCWGDEVNLAYVACTRAKRQLSIPPCIHNVFSSLDALHTWKTSSDNGANNFALLIPGCCQPLTKEQADCFYDSLVLPLRGEYEMFGEQLLKPTLVECDVEDGAVSDSDAE